MIIVQQYIIILLITNNIITHYIENIGLVSHFTAFGGYYFDCKIRKGVNKYTQIKNEIVFH